MRRQHGLVEDRSKEALEAKIHDGSAYRAFGGFTADDADSRAQALRDVAGFGPTIRVRPIAQAWGELARAMRSADAGTVADLAPAEVSSFAERLWIISSHKSMLSDPKEPPAPPTKEPPAPT